ncbi:hypothetical protein HaLaN_13569, partial [Haematococcus lacustris]
MDGSGMFVLTTIDDVAYTA